MKKMIALLGVMCLCVGLAAGCAKKNESAPKEEQTQDESFLKDLAKGLETRWKLSDSVPEDITEGSDDHKEAYMSMVDAELDIIQKYEDEKFKDSKLKEVCIQYINSLKDQKEALKYVTVDYEKYCELWDAAYNGRTKILAQLGEDYNFKVSEEYESTFDELLTNAQLVVEDENSKAKAAEFVKSIQFNLENDEYGYKTYSATVENTSGYGFVSLQLTINLLDAEGVIVETTYSNVANYGAGQKARFEFMTEKEFVSTEITADYYELSK